MESFGAQNKTAESSIERKFGKGQRKATTGTATYVSGLPDASDKLP